jgi:hypothetical protein
MSRSTGFFPKDLATLQIASNGSPLDLEERVTTGWVLVAIVLSNARWRTPGLHLLLRCLYFIPNFNVFRAARHVLPKIDVPLIIVHIIKV